MTQILDGIKVLDLTRVVAGPWCTQILADMGAQVFKIEKPGEGDDTRRMGPFMADADGNPTNESSLFLAANRNKRSVTVDFAKPEGARLLRELALQCDVVIENYKPGTLARYKLDYDSLREAKPDLIYCSLTGFGADGPYSARPAYDFILQGMAGLMSTCGQPEGSPGDAPMRTAIPMTDLYTGLYAAIMIQGALFHRERTGIGQFVDAAMIDVSVAMNAHLAGNFLMAGQVVKRAGNTNPLAAPSEVFDCADGQLIIAAGNDKQFGDLCRAMGHPEWLQAPQFARNADRVKHRTELSEKITSVTRAQPKAHWVAKLEAAGVPCGPINNLREVFDDPQVQHRDLVRTMHHPRGVDVKVVRSPLNFSQTPVGFAPAPMLGEHTEQVLRDVLNLDDAALTALRAANAI